MSTVQPASPASPAPPRTSPGAAASVWRSGRFWVAVVIVLVLGVLVWWWRHPAAFGGQGDRIGIRNEAGTVALVGSVVVPQDADGGPVTVHAVEPRVTEGSDAAKVEVLACLGGATIAARSWESLDENCMSHGDAVGARLDPGDLLILAVSSDEPQRVVVEGVKLTYSYGWQRGTQVTGMTADVTFSAPG